MPITVTDDGKIILTRDKETPDSERLIDPKDDVIVRCLHDLFKSNAHHINLNEIAGLVPDTTPAQVFATMYQNFGFVCIGTGENPALGETLTDIDKMQRQETIRQSLEAAEIPYLLIKGKYMGVEELSYFVPFDQSVTGLTHVLQSGIIKTLEKIATENSQDSILACHLGHAAYLYTFGPQKRNVITGSSAVIFSKKAQLPDDCYSLFIPGQTGDEVPDDLVAFTCGLEFNQVYENVEAFVAAENKQREEHYQDFVTEVAASKSTTENPSKKIVIVLRGSCGYNDFARALRKALEDNGVRTTIVGTDASIARINEEHPGWEWPQIRTEFLARNSQIFDEQLQRNDVEVVIYSDMNKLVEYARPYIEKALAGNHLPLLNVVNSFVFESGRSSFVADLCAKYGRFMGRHVTDFLSPESLILEPKVTVGDVDVQQSHNLTDEEFAAQVSRMIHDKRSASALTHSSVGTTFSPTGSVAAEKVPAPEVTP